MLLDASIYGRKVSAVVVGTDFFFKLGFTLCKAEQPPQGMGLQEKEAQKD